MLFLHFDTTKTGVVDRTKVLQHLEKLQQESKPKPPAPDYSAKSHKASPRPRSNHFLFAKAQFSPRAPPGMSHSNMAW